MVDGLPWTWETFPQLAAEAVQAGALGFASSRLTIHKTESGQLIPSYDAGRDEIEAIARGVEDGGGAHYGMICDASFPTYMLTHWVRDRASGRLSVTEAVRELTSAPARVAGLADRGRLTPGYQADVNVIDHAALRLHQPTVAHDLPAGGRRLDQTADGCVATIVSGQVIAENGVPTDALPGVLIRGRRPSPS